MCNRSVCAIVSILAYLLVVPRALPEWLAEGVAPESLVFTTGAAVVAIVFLVLFVLAFVDMHSQHGNNFALKKNLMKKFMK